MFRMIIISLSILKLIVNIGEHHDYILLSESIRNELVVSGSQEKPFYSDLPVLISVHRHTPLIYSLLLLQQVTARSQIRAQRFIYPEKKTFWQFNRIICCNVGTKYVC